MWWALTEKAVLLASRELEYWRKRESMAVLSGDKVALARAREHVSYYEKLMADMKSHMSPSRASWLIRRISG